MSAVRLMVPAYAHPAADPRLWQRLVRAAPVLRLVVVNPHDGPGAGPDPSYPVVMQALGDAGVRMAGYVDTDYGNRPTKEVLADVTTYIARDGLRAVFLNQVGSGLDQLDHYAQLVQAARGAGARFVALNPGTHPHPGYVDLANVTVTFEGAWEDYRRLTVPPWAHRFPASRFCHLVHSVPSEQLDEAAATASRRHVDTVMLTDGTGENPWDRLPQVVVDAFSVPHLEAARLG